MSDVSIEVPQEVAEELERRARSQGKSREVVLREALGIPAQNPFEFVAVFSSDEVSARDIDDLLDEHGFGQPG